ncbi:MAG TPA: histidine kinase N-terminal 7TM domain-containing protein [Anaerolineales bacterium]|nr:histidine kinase N-terminal 7TM domain-containing protein [Anaerolineales bacterium]
MVISLPVTAIAILIAILAFRRRTVRGSVSLIIFSFAVLAWAIAYWFFVGRLPLGNSIWLRFLLGMIYLCATVSSTTLLTFTLGYTNHEVWLTRWSLLLLSIEPILTQVFLWVGRWNKFFFRFNTPGVSLATGPWYWINATYTDGLLLLALILLAQTFIHKSRQYLLQSGTIAVGIAIPILVKILSLAGLTPVLTLELAPATYALTGLFLIFSIYRFRLLDLVPIARDTVVESMSDGWMVIDMNNRVVDLNPAAEDLIGLPRERIFGHPAERILSNWPKLNQEPSVREMEIKGSVKVHGEWRFLNVRILPLINPLEKQIGKVVLWRDITERKKSDDARQKARDEMFVLLHSISGAASQTINLNDFLAEAIYQIVYAFQSQASVIFLRDVNAAKNDEPKYDLAAHHGIPKANLVHLASSPHVAKIITWVLENKEPFYIPDVFTDPRLPPGMQASGIKSLLLVPLVTGDQVLGAIGLLRRDGLAYGQDEISRLAVVAEELASFIYSDRQRQMAIVLEERQRLVRDLHDSVTQKLYGLVALTEAAQASLETGTALQAAQVLGRIGENARQALKEMRLFLFEMKPVDLEHEGLVSVLHQRLAAVEGRADIRARLIADEKIDLPLEKQVTLYYIAQEALNNILKHANARAVMIHLKNRKSSVALEIEDDGRGFDMKNADKGGLGLRIMHERADQVGGKIKITSTPGKGTKVTATVSKDKVYPQVK